MKKAILLSLLLVGLAIYLTPEDASAASGRLYGTLRTVDGEEFEGWIRWDKNEAYWDDILDATKENKSHKSRKKYRRKDKRSRGWSFSWSTGSRQSELQFGHIKTIVPLSSNDALVILKSGEEYEMSGSDIGSGIRELEVLDRNEGEVYFEWDDVDEIDFSEEPTEPDDRAERLYGKMTTRRGDEYVGWIEWDVDEVMTTDILDGDEGRRRNRKVKFGKIKTIERRSRSSVLVTLKSGKKMKLSGTNDVNSGNRGLRVKSRDLGRVNIDWNEFDMVEFMPVPKDKLPKYGWFDGGHEIQGTVYTEDGEQYTGRIIWDDDETFTWEHLNGDYNDCTIDIPFDNIKSIEKESRRGVIVTTKSGRNIELRGSNDVDSDNDGIFILTEDGDEVEVDWYDFDRAEFR